MGAGNLNTLKFRYPAAGNAGFRLRNPFFPASNGLFFGLSLVSPPSLSTTREFRLISPTMIRANERSNQVDSNGSRRSGVPTSKNMLNSAKALLNFAVTNFLPIALVSGVALGLANPSLGCRAHSYSLSKFSTAGIFFISGLMLRSGEVRAAAEAWPAGMFGLGSILLLSPFFSSLILQLKLEPQEFVTGLAIFSCLPTTLSSGVALTQLAGANSALALAMTVMSNLLGTLIVPFSISKFIGDGFGISIPTEKLFQSLFITLLVPLVLGKISRSLFNGLAKYVDQNRKLMSMMSTVLLSLTPWMQVSKSRSLLLMVKPVTFLEAIGMGIWQRFIQNGEFEVGIVYGVGYQALLFSSIVLHLTLLAFNILAVQILSVVFCGRKSVFAKENARALIIVSSQKALLIVVAVVEQLNGSLGETGLLVLPCVAAHINQIIIDSFLVNYWLQKDRASDNLKEV